MQTVNPADSSASSVLSFPRGPLGSIPLSMLLFIGFAIRFTVLIVYLSSHDWKGETWEYEDLAQNVLNGHGYVIARWNTYYYTFVPPLFSFVCAFLHLVGGNGALYQVLYFSYHIGLALGIIWLTYRLAYTWFGPAVATLAALLVALEPGLVVYHSYKMDVITLASFWLMLGLFLFQRLTETRALSTAMILGVVIGLGLLTRLDLMILFGLLGVWLAAERQHFLAIVKPIAATVVVSLLVVSPWLVRNYLLLDQFVFISANSGEVLWYGNNAHSVGTPIALDGRPVFEHAPASLKLAVHEATNELDVNAVFRADAMRYIAQDPWRYARHVAAKFWYFWWFTPTYGMNYYQHIGQAWKVGYKVLHAGILLLAAFGAWFAFHEARRESRHALLFILTPCILLAVIHGLTYVEGRHRIMAQPLLLILAAAGAWFLWTKFKPAPQDRVNV